MAIIIIIETPLLNYLDTCYGMARRASFSLQLSSSEQLLPSCHSLTLAAAGARAKEKELH